MKTYLIALDPYDDVISVRDKMAWGKTTRLLLVWPDTDEPLLDRRLDLLLLKRRATELGGQLALVTRDPEVKSHARDLGIPVFRTSRDAQTTHWRIPREKSQLDIIRRLRAFQGPKFQISNTSLRLHSVQATTPSTSLQSLSRRPPKVSSFTHSFLRFGVFLIAVLSVATLAGLLFPTATITLDPATQSQTLTFTVKTSPSLTAVNASGAVPARPMQIIVEGRASVDSTGSLTLPDTPATGRVTLTNLTDVTVIVPVGTIVQTTNAIRYTTDRQVQVPAQAGGTVSVAITAAQPGTRGNAAAGAIQSIEGTLGLQLTVTNENPMTGGTDQVVAAPTALDRGRVYRQLLDSLGETAAAEILAQLAPGDILLNDTPLLLAELEETYSPEDTVPSDFVELTLRAEFQSFAITHADLDTLAQTVLDASLEVGYEPIPDTLAFELITHPVPDTENNATWEMRAERMVRATLSVQTAVELALGKSPSTVQTELAQTLPLSSPPVIQLAPAWWPRLPFLPFQIEILESR